MIIREWGECWNIYSLIPTGCFSPHVWFLSQ